MCASVFVSLCNGAVGGETWSSTGVGRLNNLSDVKAAACSSLMAGLSVATE